jgi:hypothetical protein
MEPRTRARESQAWWIVPVISWGALNLLLNLVAPHYLTVLVSTLLFALCVFVVATDAGEGEDSDLASVTRP